MPRHSVRSWRRVRILKISIYNMFLALVLVSGLYASFVSEYGICKLPDSQWSKTYGGPSNDYAHSLFQTCDGGFVIVGCGFANILKVDAAGNPIWSRNLSIVTDFAIKTSDKGYAIVSTRDNEFSLLKTDPNGNIEWTRTYSTEENGTWASCVAETSDGGYVITGVEDYHCWTKGCRWHLVKTDSNGIVEWNNTYIVGDLDDFPVSTRTVSVVQVSDGGFVMLGAVDETYTYYSCWGTIFLVKVDALGNLEWSKSLGQFDIGIGLDSMIQTSDGGCLIAGTVPKIDWYPEGFWWAPYGALLLKVDASGNVEWKRTYELLEGADGSSIVQTSDGGYALVRNSGSDAWIVKIDTDGNLEWMKTYGGSERDSANSIVQTKDGGYALAGTTWSYDAEEGDFWLVKDTPIGMIHILNDGSIDPPTAPISTADNATYAFTSDISNYTLVVKKEGIILDGQGYTLNGLGIVLSASNVTIRNLRITGIGIEGAVAGVFLCSSSNNHIIDNHIRSYPRGILLMKSHGNIFSRNNFDDTTHDITEYLASSNIFFHNNFKNHVHFTSQDIWDNGQEGNYWRDYTGADSDHDGIGNSEYTVYVTEDYSDVDHYPLMGMFSSFSASMDYRVNVISNSTVKNFEFFEFNNTIRMYVSKTTGNQTFGFCRACVPKDLITPNYIVTVDGAKPHYVNYSLYDNGTHRWIYFDYEHLTDKILLTIIHFLGDLNDDRIVDMRDISIAAFTFGSYPDHPRWNPQYDFNKDSKIDMIDLLLIAKNFGAH